MLQMPKRINQQRWTGSRHTYHLSFLRTALRYHFSILVPDNYTSRWTYNPFTCNALFHRYVNYTAGEWDFSRPIGPQDIGFTDPTRDVINSLNEMMFRAAVMASSWSNLTELMDPGLSANQTTVANQTITQNVF